MLPTATWSNTNTICEIQFNESNPEQYKAIFYCSDDTKGSEQSSSFLQFREKIQNKLQKPPDSLIETQQSKYRRVEIFLPRSVEILSKVGKHHLRCPSYLDILGSFDNNDRLNA